MKRLPIIILSIFLLLGFSFLVIVFRMIWFPPSDMGMMMGSNMMFYHMFFMFGQTVAVLLFIIGIVILVWIIYNYNKKS